MLFGKLENETLLTEAVINNDVEKVRKIKDHKDQVLAENWLGFNGIQLAKYLDRQECLELLEPPIKKTFKVQPKGSSNQETFTEEEFNDLFGIRYLRHLKFRNYKIFKQVIKSCNKIFFKKVGDRRITTAKILKDYESKPELFTLRAQVFANEIGCGYSAPITIEWIDDTIGYGVFADRNIKKGEYVGEFVGEIRRTAFWLKQNTYSVFYPNQAWQSFCVDGSVEGNEMRFSNHSYLPNLNTVVAAENGLIHSIFLAEKDISKGEQLTWNYGEEFWSNREPPQEI